MIKGIIIAGEFGKVIIRQKSHTLIELGELLACESEEGVTILEVYDLVYGSQINQQSLELISGIKIEEDESIGLFDPSIGNYTLAMAKPLLSKGNLCKALPPVFSTVREIVANDLPLLTSKNPLKLGYLRSGSTILDVPIILNGEQVFSHHILIPGTTGRGKSVLMSTILWHCVEEEYCGILVLDPHDEHYSVLKEHRSKHKVKYYSPIPPPGGTTLHVNITSLRPVHFKGIVHLSDAQEQAFHAYHREFGSSWVEAIILEKPLSQNFFGEGTLLVAKRLLLATLGLEFTSGQLYTHSVFMLRGGESIIHDICSSLEESGTVIIDTSSLPSHAELLIGSLLAHEIFRRYKDSKAKELLATKPVISIVLEEAPRVLSKEAGSNIFSTIAKEGRKFKVGLTAITQLPSLIPREILANMNTKIILGVEMAPERTALIESAAQDLSSAHRTIASLDKGEAIVSSTFAKFAIPLKIPLLQQSTKEKKASVNLQQFS